MKHIKKAISYSVAGSIGLTVVSLLSGCEQSQPPQPPQGSGFQQGMAEGQNLFLVIEQTGPDSYQVVEKHPTDGPTRAILRLEDGTERFMNEEELRKLAEQEAAKVEAGQSRLTEDPAMHSGGLSLGETILAAAAGSLIGGMIANKLMNNSNFQKNQQTYGGGRPTASISQPYNRKTSSSFSKSSSQPKSGFFGGSKSSTSSSRSFGG